MPVLASIEALTLHKALTEPVVVREPVLAPIEALISDLIISQPLHLIHDLSHRVQNLVCRRKFAVL